MMGDLLSPRKRPWALHLGPSTLLGQLWPNSSLSPSPGVRVCDKEAKPCLLHLWFRDVKTHTALKELKMFLCYIYSLIVRNH